MSYYQREICTSKCVGFEKKKSCEHQDNSLSLKQLNPNSTPMGVYLGGLITGRIFESEIWGGEGGG